MKKRKGLKIKLICFALVVILVLGIVVFPMCLTTIPSALSISQHIKNPPKLIAHRGFSSIYPENTLPAFEGAAKAGFWGMECDIQTTKDGRWVVIHDDEISNQTTGEGLVSDYTFDALMEFQNEKGNNIEDYGTLDIPSLEQYLQVCVDDGNIIPVIEIKNCDTKYLPSLKRIIAEFNLSDKAVLISFTAEYLTEYRKIDKNAEIFLLHKAPTTEDIDFCTQNNFGINFFFLNLYKCISAISYAKENNVPIGAWTLDNTVYTDVMALFGAEYITTNKLVP